MPHPGAWFWFAMCLAGWCSGRMNCLPKLCMCWQANSCLLICSLVCTNSDCLHSLLRACLFFLLSLMKTRTTDSPSLQCVKPVFQAHLHTFPPLWQLGYHNLVHMAHRWVRCYQETQWQLQIHRFLGKGALNKPAPSSGSLTFTCVACAKWSNSETVVVSLFSWTIPNAFSFVSSSTLLSSLIVWGRQGGRSQ